MVSSVIDAMIQWDGILYTRDYEELVFTPCEKKIPTGIGKLWLQWANSLSNESSPIALLVIVPRKVQNMEPCMLENEFSPDEKVILENCFGVQDSSVCLVSIGQYFVCLSQKKKKKFFLNVLRAKEWKEQRWWWWYGGWMNCLWKKERWVHKSGKYIEKKQH